MVLGARQTSESLDIHPEHGSSLEVRSSSSSSSASPEQILSLAVEAAANAMAEKVANFASAGEAAFGQLHLGCRCCAKFPGALEAVGHDQKCIVVAFLARLASRRSAERCVQDLCELLITSGSPSWCTLLATAPAPLPDILKKVLAAATANEKAKLGERQLAENSPSTSRPWLAAAPKHDARIFLREHRSQRYLTVAAVLSVECCIMTELPASLFVCRWQGQAGFFEAIEVSDSERESGLMSTRHKSSQSVIFGFVHEGVPAFNRFISCRRSWRRAASIRAGLARDVGDVVIRCSGRRLGNEECFRWGPGSTLQHAYTKQWLCVDPAIPDRLTTNMLQGSIWEVLSAT